MVRFMIYLLETGICLSLLYLARLAKPFQWALIAATVVIVGVASLISLGILVVDVWAEWFIRLLGVLAILDAAFSVLIPVFHRLSRSMLEKSAPPVSEQADDVNAIAAGEVEPAAREVRNAANTQPVDSAYCAHTRRRGAGHSCDRIQRGHRCIEESFAEVGAALISVVVGSLNDARAGHGESARAGTHSCCRSFRR